MPKYLGVSQRNCHQTALDQIKALPGVRSASVASFRPMGDFRGGIWGLVVPGRSDQPVAVARYVLPDYFATMRIPLKLGRDFTAADTAASNRVAVVSESFANMLLARTEPHRPQLRHSVRQPQIHRRRSGRQRPLPWPGKRE